jgi:membrane protein
MPGFLLRSSLRNIWFLLRDTVEGFVEDDALSRGASIAYYTLFSLAPILLIAIAIAGLAFRRDAARGAIVEQLSGLMGGKSAEALQAMIESASDPKTGLTASIIGILAAAITLTGAFGEVQSALNAIWKTKSRRSTLSRLMRARLASLGLVATSGFLLTVSLVVSAALAAVSNYLKVVFPGAELVLQIADIAISGALLTGMFAAIFKILPDTPIAWRDVAIGALVTAGLFEGGKYVIALYIGTSNVASSYGAAGALIILLLWIFYSAQIFLLGAEFTRAFARRYGTHVGREVSNPTPS